MINCSYQDWRQKLILFLELLDSNDSSEQNVEQESYEPMDRKYI